MPFHELTEEQRRSICKSHIESLEFWLRRLIHKELSEKYGDKYFEHQGTDGQHLFNKSLRDNVSFIMTRSGKSYQRWIDATVIENIIEIVTKPNLYQDFFRQAFSTAFVSEDQLRINLNRVATIRNSVYHSNHISVRDVEQSVCYSNDVIDCIKEHYRQKNMGKDFNVPTFLKFTDSVLGDVHIGDGRSGGVFRIHRTSKSVYSGDTISLEVEVDASFGRDSYTIEWSIQGTGDANHAVIKLTDKEVTESYWVDIRLTSKTNSWHRFNSYDDRIQIEYRVLPRD